MTTSELIRTRHKGSQGLGPAHTYQADEALAAALPRLALPCMGEAARAALRVVIPLEVPYTNEDLEDCLALAEARGFCTDPRDWVPDFKCPRRHLPLYQPWVDWLTDHGLTQIHAGNTLTAENLSRWTPAALRGAFSGLARNDRAAAADIVFHHSGALPTGHRAAILETLHAAGSFSGSYPWQVPLIHHFLNDRAAKIRDSARVLIDRMEGLETEEAHAAVLARHLTVSNGRVSYAERSDNRFSPFYRHWASTTFAALAEALGLTPAQLAHGAELEFLDGQFQALATASDDTEVRTILLRRLLATRGGEEIAMHMFRGLDSGLRERGLQAYFKSNYWHSVQDFLGPERGHLTPTQMYELAAFEALEASVIRQINERKLPVNSQYDPLRAVALSVGKEAAQEALDRALAAGMKPDNPRLTMLRLNLAL